MGIQANVGYREFPVQYGHQGKRCTVRFRLDKEKAIPGVIVRHDSEPPYVAIIRLDDGRYVLGSECIFSTEGTAVKLHPAESLLLSIKDRIMRGFPIDKMIDEYFVTRGK